MDAVGRWGVVAAVTWALGRVILAQKKLKGRWAMGAAVDYKAPDVFYRAEEGGETIPWRRNSWRWVKFFNAFILGRREEGVVPISEGESSTWEDSCFSLGGVTGGCNGAATADI
jgi:hypothetical protein